VTTADQNRRRRSGIDKPGGLGAVDRKRLNALLESAFGRALMPGAMEDGGLVAAQAEHVYLEETTVAPPCSPTPTSPPI
jgi:hypothetical protein